MKGPDLEKDELPDFLRDLKKENPFKIPEGYFSRLQNEIWKRWNQTDRKTISSSGKLEVWQRRIIITTGLAAVILVFIWIGGSWFTGSESLDMDIPRQELVQYVRDHIDEFIVEDFYSMETLEISVDDPILPEGGTDQEELEILLEE